MGIYLFRRHALEEFLYEFPEADDFAQHVIPGLLLCGHRIATHYFAEASGPRYWRDIGDPEGYHAAHMDLLRGTFDDGESWIGPHSLVAGAELERCVLGRNVQVGPGATVRDSILLDGATVGPGARVCNAIVDENVRIAAHAHIGSGTEITVITEPVAAAIRHPAAY
jgi:glucose-1-phosphate adenylyltransferase